MPEIQPGIYLEIKKGTIGTGHTAKDAEYRNFWMMLHHEAGEVTLLLLDEDFKMTAIRETLSEAEFLSGRFNYIPQGDKRYQLLKRKLEEIQKAAGKKPDAPGGKAAPESRKKAEANWWDSPQPAEEGKDIFSTRGPDGRKPEPPPESGNWWERPSKPAPSTRTRTVKKKKSSTEKTLKKSWWDN